MDEVLKRGKRNYNIPSPLSTPKEISGSHGHRPAGTSIRWPALYRHLRKKGHSKQKAAMISNGQWRKKRGLPPKSVPGTKGKVGINKGEHKLYYFEGRNTGIAALSAEEARAKKKRGGDKLVGVRTPTAAERAQMRAGIWVRTRVDGKSPEKSKHGTGRGYGPPRVKKMQPAPSDVLVEKPAKVNPKKLKGKDRKKRLHDLIGTDLEMKKARQPRDGDGDGFVNDGKPGMRPVTPKMPKSPFKKPANPPRAADRGAAGMRGARTGDMVGREVLQEGGAAAFRTIGEAFKGKPKQLRAVSYINFDKLGLTDLSPMDRSRLIVAMADVPLGKSGRYTQQSIKAAARALGHKPKKGGDQRPFVVVAQKPEVRDPVGDAAVRHIRKTYIEKSTLTGLLRSARAFKESMVRRAPDGKFADKPGSGMKKPSPKAARKFDLQRAAPFRGGGGPDTAVGPAFVRAGLPKLNPRGQEAVMRHLDVKPNDVEAGKVPAEDLRNAAGELGIVRAGTMRGDQAKPDLSVKLKGVPSPAAPRQRAAAKKPAAKAPAKKAPAKKAPAKKPENNVPEVATAVSAVRAPQKKPAGAAPRKARGQGPGVADTGGPPPRPIKGKYQLNVADERRLNRWMDRGDKDKQKFLRDNKAKYEDAQGRVNQRKLLDLIDGYEPPPPGSAALPPVNTGKPTPEEMQAVMRIKAARKRGNMPTMSEGEILQAQRAAAKRAAGPGALAQRDAAIERNLVDRIGAAQKRKGNKAIGIGSLMDALLGEGEGGVKKPAARKIPVPPVSPIATKGPDPKAKSGALPKPQKAPEAPRVWVRDVYDDGRKQRPMPPAVADGARKLHEHLEGGGTFTNMPSDIPIMDVLLQAANGNIQMYGVQVQKKGGTSSGMMFIATDKDGKQFFVKRTGRAAFTRMTDGRREFGWDNYGDVQAEGISADLMKAMGLPFPDTNALDPREVEDAILVQGSTGDTLPKGRKLKKLRDGADLMPGRGHGDADFPSRVQNRGDIAKTLLMDYLIGNVDRHPGNYQWLEDDKGDLHFRPIDHGLAFHQGLHPGIGGIQGIPKALGAKNWRDDELTDEMYDAWTAATPQQHLQGAQKSVWLAQEMQRAYGGDIAAMQRDMQAAMDQALKMKTDGIFDGWLEKAGGDMSPGGDKVVLAEQMFIDRIEKLEDEGIGAFMTLIDVWKVPGQVRKSEPRQRRARRIEKLNGQRRHPQNRLVIHEGP